MAFTKEIISKINIYVAIKPMIQLVKTEGLLYNCFKSQKLRGQFDNFSEFRYKIFIQKNIYKPLHPIFKVISSSFNALSYCFTYMYGIGRVPGIQKGGQEMYCKSTG